MACCNVRAALLMRSNKRPEDVGHCFSILTRCFAYVLFLFFSLSPVAASFCVYIHFFVLSSFVCESSFHVSMVSSYPVVITVCITLTVCMSNGG